MKSDISYEEKYIEGYRLDTPEQMQESQRIIYSQPNFFKWGYGRSYKKEIEKRVWAKRSWMSEMNVIVVITKSNHVMWGWGRGGSPKPYNEFLKKWRYQMNEIIIEMFPVTKEAVLVDKWFGREIDKPIFKMLIKGKEKELYAEAQRLEKENNKSK